MDAGTLALLDRRLLRVEEEYFAERMTFLDEVVELQAGDSGPLNDAARKRWQAGQRDTSTRLIERLRAEVNAVVDQTQQVFTPDGKTSVLQAISKYFDVERHNQRLRILDAAYRRRNGWYQSTPKLRVALVENLQGSSSTKFLHRGLEQLSDDLELIAQRHRSSFYKLEPSFHGISINIRYLVRRLFGWPK